MNRQLNRHTGKVTGPYMKLLSLSWSQGIASNDYLLDVEGLSVKFQRVPYQTMAE